MYLIFTTAVPVVCYGGDNRILSWLPTQIISSFSQTLTMVMLQIPKQKLSQKYQTTSDKEIEEDEEGLYEVCNFVCIFYARK